MIRSSGILVDVMYEKSERSSDRSSWSLLEDRWKEGCNGTIPTSLVLLQTVGCLVT